MPIIAFYSFKANAKRQSDWVFPLRLNIGTQKHKR